MPYAIRAGVDAGAAMQMEADMPGPPSPENVRLQLDDVAPLTRPVTAPLEMLTATTIHVDTVLVGCGAASDGDAVAVAAADEVATPADRDGEMDVDGDIEVDMDCVGDAPPIGDCVTGDCETDGDGDAEEDLEGEIDIDVEIEIVALSDGCRRRACRSRASACCALASPLVLPPPASPSNCRRRAAVVLDGDKEGVAAPDIVPEMERVTVGVAVAFAETVGVVAADGLAKVRETDAVAVAEAVAFAGTVWVAVADGLAKARETDAVAVAVAFADWLLVTARDVETVGVAAPGVALSVGRAVGDSELTLGTLKPRM